MATIQEISELMDRKFKQHDMNSETRGILNDMNCSKIDFKGECLGKENDLIYINEKLTPEKSKLFANARDVKKKGYFKAASVNKGDILVRTIDDEAKTRKSEVKQNWIFL